MGIKVLFTGGGTAGHINPALAAAGYLKQEGPTLRFSMWAIRRDGGKAGGERGL